MHIGTDHLSQCSRELVGRLVPGLAAVHDQCTVVTEAGVGQAQLLERFWSAGACARTSAAVALRSETTALGMWSSYR
ncbi:MAG: hypothetical protein M3N28_07580 [Actinomycetota bacterium]|nr:hypothetical protein [Actinomycetota bacterium]